MKTKLKYAIACALVLAVSACSNKVHTSSSSSLQAEKTLLDLMQEKIKGLNVGVWPTSYPPRAGLTGGSAGTFSAPIARKMSYKIFNKELHLVIDGEDVDRFYSPDVRASAGTEGDYVQDRNNASMRDRMQFIETYLKTIKAEDVTDLKLLSNAEYIEKYKPTFAYKIDGSLSVATTGFAYVEVTTRSGEGAFMK